MISLSTTNEDSLASAHIRKRAPTSLLVMDVRLLGSYSQFTSSVLEIPVPEDYSQNQRLLAAIAT